MSEPDLTAFDDTLPADDALRGGLKRATASGHTLMAVFGANWCPDARAFIGLLNDYRLQSRLQDWPICLIDVGRYDRNVELAETVIAETLIGVPAIALVSPNRELINAGHVYDWRTARSSTVEDLLTWLDERLTSPSRLPLNLD